MSKKLYKNNLILYLYTNMIIFITVSSLALIFLIYKTCKCNKISLDTKLNEYDTQRGNISEYIIFYQKKII